MRQGTRVPAHVRTLTALGFTVERIRKDTLYLMGCGCVTRGSRTIIPCDGCHAFRGGDPSRAREQRVGGHPRLSAI